MLGLAHHIESCLAGLGTPAFAPVFANFAEAAGAHQVMVFAVQNSQATCLMSRHFNQAGLGGELAARYLNEWFLKDPLFPVLLAAPSGSLRLFHLEQIEDQMSADYRQIFFDIPGLSSKMTVLAVGERLRLFVSLYQSEGCSMALEPELVRLAGRLALLHFERTSDDGLPAPLAVLSTREQAVCRGILLGMKTEAIAADLAVAASTVITYRKRAYAKLGINSRAALFALCRLGKPQP